MHPEIVAESRLGEFEGQYRGHDGVRRWWGDMIAFMPDYRIDPVDIQAREDLLICRFRGTGHGASSGVPLQDMAWLVSRWRDGLCDWWRVCRSEEEALKARPDSA